MYLQTGWDALLKAGANSPRSSKVTIKGGTSPNGQHVDRDYLPGKVVLYAWVSLIEHCHRGHLQESINACHVGMV